MLLGIPVSLACVPGVCLWSVTFLMNSPTPRSATWAEKASFSCGGREFSAFR